MKRYVRADNIFAMSQSRKQVLQDFQDLGGIINTHIIKCVVYGNTLSNDLPHWIHEIATWIADANSIKCKSKIKEKDYRDMLFGSFGDDLEDAWRNLRRFKLRNGRLLNSEPYPDFDITDEMVDKLFDAYQDLVDVCVPILVSGKPQTINKWQQLITPVLSSE